MFAQKTRVSDYDLYRYLHLMVAWIRIRTWNADPEDVERAKMKVTVKRKKITQDQQQCVQVQQSFSEKHH
jgi:hypothetical protein